LLLSPHEVGSQKVFQHCSPTAFFFSLEAELRMYDVLIQLIKFLNFFLANANPESSFYTIKIVMLPEDLLAFKPFQRILAEVAWSSGWSGIRFTGWEDELDSITFIV